MAAGPSFDRPLAGAARKAGAGTEREGGSMSETREMKKFGPYDHLQIMNYLPHRYPFLFVDRILSVEVPYGPDGQIQQVGTKVMGIKNATINEPYFAGH